MNESKLTKEEKRKVMDYLNKNAWRKGWIEFEIRCPICGGIIKAVEHGSGYETKCSTPGCFYDSIRGI